MSQATDLNEFFQKNFPEQNPRHIEAWIRSGNNGRINNLSWAQIKREGKLAVACIKSAGEADSEALAQSYGL